MTGAMASRTGPPDGPAARTTDLPVGSGRIEPAILTSSNLLKLADVRWIATSVDAVTELRICRANGA